MKKVMALVGLVGVLTLMGCGDPQDGGKEAIRYAQQLYPDWHVIAALPAGQDSDADGYVSVTVRMEKNGQERVIYLQCGYGMYGGCKSAPIGQVGQ